MKRKPSLFKMLRKADAPVKIADMIKQATEPDNMGNPKQPYRQRFSRSSGLKMNQKDYDQIVTHKQPNGYFHHIGYKGNHKFHTYSAQEHPGGQALAGIITAQVGDNRHIRGAISNSMAPTHLNNLKAAIQQDPEFQYSDEPLVLDQQKHAEKGWEDYNTDLFHGLAPDVTIGSTPNNTVTNWLSFAGKPGDKTPRVVAKEMVDIGHANSAERSHFEHPRFTTAHREAAYHKLADQVFGMGQYVPRSTVFRHPANGKPWSAMEFIPGAKPIEDPATDKTVKGLEDNGDIYKLAIMNMILGNNDRHQNNFIKDPSDKFHLIDHGLTFDYNHITTDVIPAYVRHLLDKPVPESVHQWLWSLDIPKMAELMNGMGAPHEAIMTAAGRLADARKWSNLVKHGSRVYEVKPDEMHRGLGPLYEMIKARQHKISNEERNSIQSHVQHKIMTGMRPAIGLPKDDSADMIARVDPQTAKTDLIQTHPSPEKRVMTPTRKKGSETNE